MTTTKQTAAEFFYDHAGWSHGPGETLEQGRRRCARTLAQAETWLIEQPGFKVEWHQDVHYDPADYDVGDMPGIGWGCIVTVGVKIASLWAITFDGDGHPSGNPYARVVVAELASELMSE